MREMLFREMLFRFSVTRKSHGCHAGTTFLFFGGGGNLCLFVHPERLRTPIRTPDPTTELLQVSVFLTDSHPISLPILISFPFFP